MSGLDQFVGFSSKGFMRLNEAAILSQACRECTGGAARSSKDPEMNKGASLTADASRRASLLIAYIHPVCALLAPRRAGASTPRLGTLIHFRVLTCTFVSAHAAVDEDRDVVGSGVGRDDVGFAVPIEIANGQLARIGSDGEVHFRGEVALPVA